MVATVSNFLHYDNIFFMLGHNVSFFIDLLEFYCVLFIVVISSPVIPTMFMSFHSAQGTQLPKNILLRLV